MTEVKKTIFLIVFAMASIVATGQVIFTQEISAEDRRDAKKRAELKLSSNKYIKSDSSYFYIENYDKNGQLISHYDSDSIVIKYDYNDFGKRTRAIRLIVNRPDTVWEAQYIGDTLLIKVKRDNDSEFIEEILFDNLERKIKCFKNYRKSDRTDSIITVYSDKGRTEISYEYGKPVLKIVEKKDSSSSTEEYYHFNKRGSATHYLTWTSKFDLNGKETLRVQQDFDRDETIEYITTYTEGGFEKMSTVKTNGKVDFETVYYYDSDNRLIATKYQEQDYKQETDYFYNEINLESKSLTRTFKKGEKPEIELYFSTYQFYTDK